MNNTITELRNNSEGIKSRLADTEEWISGLEDRIVEIIQSEQHKEKWLKKLFKGSLDSIKHKDIHIIGIPEGEEWVKQAENLFEEIIAENISNLRKETDTLVQEAQTVASKMNPKIPTPRIIIKMTKDKDKK